MHENQAGFSFRVDRSRPAEITLSVVVPTRGRPAALKRLLTALEPQLINRFERSLVVVNDGSHDDEYEAIIRPFSAMLDYIVLPTHCGIMAARNAGARRAFGAFLVCTDDDCEPAPDWLDMLAALIAANPRVDVVLGSVRHLSRRSAGLVERYLAITREVAKPWLGPNGHYEGPSANLAMRRDLFVSLNGFDERLGKAGGEDCDICYRAAAAGATVVPAAFWATYHAHDFGLPKFLERFARYGRGVVRYRVFVGERAEFWCGRDGSLFQLLVHLPWLRYAPERPLIAAAQCGLPERWIFYVLVWLQSFAYQWGARSELRLRWEHVENIANEMRRLPSPNRGGTSQTSSPNALNIIIATHGRPVELDWLLHRLRPQVQGHPSRRIIVVNDGSHDERYAAVIERSRDIVDYVVMPQKRGPAAARNYGAARVADGHAVFIGDDCEPPKDWLDKLTAIISKRPDADAIGGVTRPLSSPLPTLLRGFLIDARFYPQSRSLDGQLVTLVSANLAVRLSAFRSVGGFDEMMMGSEDRNLTFRLTCQGANCLLDSSWFVYLDMSTTLRQHFRRCYRYGFGVGRQLQFESSPPDRSLWPADERRWDFWLRRIQHQFGQAASRRDFDARPQSVRMLYVAMAAVTALVMDVGFVNGRR